MKDWLLKVPAAVVATGVIMGFMWKAFLSSAVIASVTESVAADLHREVADAVAAQVAPVNAGLKATIQSAIAQFEDDIAALEYRQQLQDGSWSAEDAQRLANKRRRLREQQMALEAIEDAEKGDGR